MIRVIHDDLIIWYGGRHFLHDLNRLESTLASLQQLAQYESEAGIGQLAAVLGWGLIKNHAFLEGNKRIALAAVITFLNLNGYKLTCSEAEETTVVLRAAVTEMDEAEWTAWVVRNAGPV